MEGNYEDGSLSLHRYTLELEKYESGSVHELLLPAKLFSCVCGRHPGILAETTRLADKAVAINPHSPEALLELANQLSLDNKLPEAAKLYRAVTKLDDSSVKALTELTSVQLAQNGPTDQVSEIINVIYHWFCSCCVCTHSSR